MLWMLIKVASFHCYCFLKLFSGPSNAALYAGFLLYLCACLLFCFWLIAYCYYANKAYLDNRTLLHHGCHDLGILICSLWGASWILYLHVLLGTHKEVTCLQNAAVLFSFCWHSLFLKQNLPESILWSLAWVSLHVHIVDVCKHSLSLFCFLIILFVSQNNLSSSANGLFCTDKRHLINANKGPPFFCLGI